MNIALLEAWRVPEARAFFANVWPMYVHEITGFGSDFYSLDAGGRWQPDLLGDWIAPITPRANLRTPRADADPEQPFQRTYVITEDARPIGFVCIGLPPFAYIPDDVDVHIAEFFLVRGRRGSGAAQRVLELLLELHAGKARWHLLAVHDNARAIAFWTKVLPRAGARDIELRTDGRDLAWRFTSSLRAGG